MDKGMVIHPVIPGRSEPSDKSEMVTQLLFGEAYDVLDSHRNWLFVENRHDGYKCWIDKKQHNEAPDDIEQSYDSSSLKRCGDPFGFLTGADNHRYGIPCGAILRGYKEGRVHMYNRSLLFEGRVARHDSESIIRHAWRFLHAPYLWGGKTAFGIDCSGLMQVIFNCAGIDLPRDAYQQATVGESVDFVDMTEPGDLVFFDNEEQRITHVGVVIEKERILHASGCVRIDKLDHQGIFNADVNSYTHKLRLIRRVIPG